MTTQDLAATSAPTGPVAPEGVNHLVLNVRDMERAHAFYTRILGFKQVGEIRDPARPAFWMRFYQGALGNHHDLALAQVADPAAIEDPDKPWSMAARRTGINHMAIKWPNREAWLQQLAWMQSQGVTFHSRIDHGMSHSAYVSDPDGHGIEVLYELPREVWEEDINAALDYAKVLPRDGAEALSDDTAYKVFGRGE